VGYFPMMVKAGAHETALAALELGVGLKAEFAQEYLPSLNENCLLIDFGDNSGACIFLDGAKWLAGVVSMKDIVTRKEAMEFARDWLRLASADGDDLYQDTTVLSNDTPPVKWTH
jgi:hypothetical protein